MLKIMISVALCLAYFCLSAEGAAVSSNQLRNRNYNVPNGPRNANVPNAGPNQFGQGNFNNQPNAGPNQFGQGNFNNQPNAADPCSQRRLECERNRCKERCLNLRFRTGTCVRADVWCGDVQVEVRACKCSGNPTGSESAYAGEGSSSNATNSDADNSNSLDSSAAESSRNSQETSTAPQSTATNAAPKTAGGANSPNLAPAAAASGAASRASNSAATGKDSQ